MDDLISRQAAIDAVEESRRLNHHQDGKMACAHEYEHRHFLKLLKDLPPAQPEPNYDEWCTNCKEYDHENSCCPRWTKVIRQTRRELQDEFVMTAVDGTLWVTVDDVQKVGRVIVDEDKSKFCRQFYMDAKPEPCEDVVSRQAAIDAIENAFDRETILNRFVRKIAISAVRLLPPVMPKQPEYHEIGYRECADAVLKMWMDNVLTDGEHNRIIDKLNAKWAIAEGDAE